MTVKLDTTRLQALAAERSQEFASASPFPFTVIDDFLPAEDAERVLEEFDEAAAGWNHYHHYNEKKLALTDIRQMGAHTQQVFHALEAREFVDFVETLTGIEGLISDPDLDGAGMHKIQRGGFLNVHTDFLSHTLNRHWSRQINLLIYFNKNWEAEWNGNLELWDPEMQNCVESVEPVFNRAVIFNTCATSYHGHPAPLTCPPGVSRKSLALYYFCDEGETQALTSTHYRGTPDDPLHKKALVVLDRWGVRAYSFLKRYSGLKDGMVSRILKRF
jgi:Rps23 Pro-64 3,4-dihydroxylase Tpa1-like proline 4-hydroxylase